MEDLNFTIEDCNDVVEHSLHSNTAQTIDFEVIPRHQNNYIFKITIVNNGSKKDTLYFYAKPGSDTPIASKIIYENFKNLLPEFSYTITPKFICGKLSLLFFEDLTCHRFQNYFNLFDIMHIQQVLKVLAEFHAASFAYENKILKKLNEEFELQEANIEWNEAEDLLLTCVNNKDSIEEIKRKLKEIQTSSNFSKTLCHNNLTPNNLLFHYENGIPYDCKLINFKGKLYAPPFYDVLQMIFFNTDGNFRRKNLDSLLSYYYHELSEKMSKYHLDIGKFLPFDDIKLSSYKLLPLVKLETALLSKNNNRKEETLRELKEILSFSRLTREDCYMIIKNKLKSDDYELLSFSSISDQISSDSFKASIKICYCLEEKSINCFVKNLKSVPSKNHSFKKEVFMYNTYLPQLENFKITVSDCLPACYFERNEDLAVFEDLSLANFCSFSPLKSYDFKLLTIIVTKLAKLHASSLVLEKKKATESTYRLIDEYQDLLSEVLFDRLDFSSDKLESAINDVVNLFPELKSKINDENLEKSFPKLTDFFLKAKTQSDRFKNVISHGDLKSKNILVQFDDDVPVDCRFINWESVKYCPPANDFLSVLYLTTNRETRIKNEEALKIIYYDELRKFVSSYNHKIDNILSYEEFIDSIEYQRPQFVLQAIIYNSFILSSPEKISSVLTSNDECNWLLSEDRKNYLPEMCEKSKIFKEKLKENVLDLYEICSKIVSNI